MTSDGFFSSKSSMLMSQDFSILSTNLNLKLLHSYIMNTGSIWNYWNLAGHYLLCILVMPSFYYKHSLTMSWWYLQCILVLPCPRELTLERQLTNSIVISWKPPLNHSQLDVKSYHVYADGAFKSLVRKNERTKALLENMDSKEVRRNFVNELITQY